MTVGLNLFGFTVEVADVLQYFGRAGKTAGPFVVVERASGKAFETTDDARNGWQPWLGTLDGNPGQRWIFERSSEREEIVIRSELNGLALDCTWDNANHAPLLLWDPHGEANQRWQLRKRAGSPIWFLASAKDGRVIDVGPPGDRAVDSHPLMYDYHGAPWQQFLVLPIG